MNTVIESVPETTVTPAKMSAESIAYRVESWQREQKRYALCIDILNRLGAQLTDQVHFSPCVYISVTVSNREDLTVLMTLAPKWSKVPSGNGIIYCATVEGEEVQLAAQNAALPSTCKLVEEEYEIPAVEAKPASTGKRMVLKCDKLEATP